MSLRWRLAETDGWADRFVMVAVDATAAGSGELGLAAVAHLSRYRGISREHTESDLRVFFAWCHERHLAPLSAQRNDLELYTRWMQDIRRFKPSTVSRRLSVVAGFYRTCVIDDVLEHSPAEYVRRPRVPPESPTLGLTHLQFEALLTAARVSPNTFDFALVCMLGLLGLRIFETVGADIEELGEEHGHRVLRVRAKAARSCSSHCHPQSAARSSGPPAIELAGRCCSTRGALGWTATPRPAGCVTSPATPESAYRGCIHTCCATRSSPPCSTLASTCGTSRSQPDMPDPRTTMRYDRARRNLDRHPNYILAAYMASGT